MTEPRSGTSVASRHRRFRCGSRLALTATVVVLGWGSVPAQADGIPPPPPLFPPATVKKVAASTTTSTPAPTSTTRAVVPAAAVRSSTTTASDPTTSVSPAVAQAMLAQSLSVRRTPPSTTYALLAALAPLQHLGFTPEQAAIAGMGQFPVAGPAYYADGWLEYRAGPPPALHHGIDIVAAMGTPLRASVDGILRYDTTDPAGYGLAATVTGADGTVYLMGHLSATVKSLSTGAAVTQGQVVGFVGSSGDSTGPHCHFEIHLPGGVGIDAKPTLDRWQAEALAAVPALIGGVEASRAPPVSVPASVPVPPLLTPAHAGPVPTPAQTLTSRNAGASRPGMFTGIGLLGLLAALAAMAPGLGRRRRQREDGEMDDLAPLLLAPSATAARGAGPAAPSLWLGATTPGPTGRPALAPAGSGARGDPLHRS